MIRSCVLLFWSLAVASIFHISLIRADASHTESGASAPSPAGRDQEFSSDPKFCFVVRTYWGHGDDHGGGLRNLLASLQRQEHKRWEAVLLVADSTPFKSLHNIVQDMADNRIWVFAEWIGEDFAPKDEDNEWSDGYHAMLFNLTDNAIQVCSPDTEWVIVTNGDNLYANGFLDRAKQEIKAKLPTPRDIIAFDFYSRFLRSTRPSCERFEAFQAFPCKRNRVKWCQTDLGANVINWRKLLAEKRRFGTVDSSKFSGGCRGLDDPHNDGLLMQQLTEEGWTVAHVHDACLFNHGTSPQECAWTGGAWDDRDTVAVGGGTCITLEEAENLFAANKTMLEIVTIDVANDNQTSRFGVGTHPDTAAGQILALKCLRRRDYLSEEVMGNTLGFYSELCADTDLDAPGYNASLAYYYPEDWREIVEERMKGFDPPEPSSGEKDAEEDEYEDVDDEEYYSNYADEL